MMMLLLSFFCQTPLSKKNKKKGLKEELEERLISLIASLFGKKTSKLLLVNENHSVLNV